MRRRLGAEVSEAVDWRRPRAICVAAEFSRHDRAAVSLHRRDHRVDLVRYRVFGPDLLTLQLVETVPGVTASVWPMPTCPVGDADDGSSAARAPAQASQVEVPECLRELYGELDEVLTAAGDLEVMALNHHVAYRRMLNVASVVFRPGHQVLLTYLRLDPDTVELEPGFTRDVRGTGHLGTGDLEVRIASSADLEKAGALIRRAVEES
ncbi:COG1479 DNAse/DNA nickase C-terminal domain-containing protein [Kitasatospora sp. Ki12]